MPILVLILASSCAIDERGLELAVITGPHPGSGDSSGASGSLSDSEGAVIAGSGGVASSESGSSGVIDIGHSAGAPSAAGASGTAGVDSGGAGGSLLGACADLDANGVDDCSQTLVQNSRFDLDVTSWGSAASWDERDARSAESAGSLLVSNQISVAGLDTWGMVSAEQCIQVTGDLQFKVAARFRIPGGQEEGEAAINLWIFGHDDCQGAFITAFTPASSRISDEWSTLAGQIRMPTAARSMLVRLASLKPFHQPQFSVLFDDVLVTHE